MKLTPGLNVEFVLIGFFQSSLVKVFYRPHWDGGSYLMAILSHVAVHVKKFLENI